MGVVFRVWVVAAERVAAAVAVVDVTMPVPVMAVCVGRAVPCVAVDVGGGCVCVGALVAVMTIGVLLGAGVKVGMDATVCSTWTATVDWMSGITGAGLVTWG